MLWWPITYRYILELLLPYRRCCFLFSDSHWLRLLIWMLSGHWLVPGYYPAGYCLHCHASLLIVCLFSMYLLFLVSLSVPIVYLFSIFFVFSPLSMLTSSFSMTLFDYHSCCLSWYLSVHLLYLVCFILHLFFAFLYTVT
mgnify:FL=1